MLVNDSPLFFDILTVSPIFHLNLKKLLLIQPFFPFSPVSFLSSRLDRTINLYSLTDLKLGGSSNQPLKTLSGHTSFVYSLSDLASPEGELVSSGEDRSLRVWRGEFDF